MASFPPSPSYSRLVLEIGQATRCSPDHPRNEDFHGVALAQEGKLAWGALVCVADGIGGSADGRLAAEVTVHSLLEDYFATPLGWRGTRALYEVANSINDWLFREGRWHTGGLGTTLVAALFRDRTLYVLSAGDSRLYRWREGRLLLLTRDHLFGGPEMSALTKAVGLDNRFTPDLREEILQEGDRYLLLSDGVWRETGEADLRRWVDPAHDPQTAATGLVAEAGKRSRDDATAVVVEVRRLPAAKLPELIQEWRVLPVILPPQTGTRLDGFQILRILHQSMHSTVFLAWDEENRQEVVLKLPDLLTAADAGWMDGFSREEWIGLQVRHPNLMRVVPQSPQRRRTAYHVWEYLEGHTLEQLRSERGRRGLPAAEVFVWLQQAAKGLLALHRQGIVHRDVKPDNLFLTHDQRLVVIDFGTARIIGIDVSSHPTVGQRLVAGTPGFMAPELYQGNEGSPASDLFALGVTGYLLLSGRFPYGQPEPHLTPAFDPFTPLTILRPELPPPLAAVIERCLALRQEDRPGDLGELLSWLEQSELCPPPPVALRQCHSLRLYKFGFWMFFMMTTLLLLLRLRG